MCVCIYISISTIESATLCAQVHELPQSHYDDSQEDTYDTYENTCVYTYTLHST